MKPSKLDIMIWRSDTGKGWKAAAAHFKLTLADTHRICGHVPKTSSKAKQCPRCKELMQELARVSVHTEATARVKGSRELFLSRQLEEALGDLEVLRTKERSGTAISVQTRTISDLREQLDDERRRLIAESGNPLDQLHSEELLADILENLYNLPPVLYDRIAAAVAEKYGKTPELLLD